MPSGKELTAQDACARGARSCSVLANALASTETAGLSDIILELSVAQGSQSGGVAAALQIFTRLPATLDGRKV